MRQVRCCQYLPGEDADVAEVAAASAASSSSSEVGYAASAARAPDAIERHTAASLGSLTCTAARPGQASRVRP